METISRSHTMCDVNASCRLQWPMEGAQHVCTKARWTLSLPQTSRANPVQCCSTHQKKMSMPRVDYNDEWSPFESKNQIYCSKYYTFHAGGRMDFTKGNLRKSKSASSILQARSILPTFRLRLTCFCVPSFQDLFVFHLVQKFPPGFFRTGSGTFPAASSARAFDVTIHRNKAPSSVYK